MNERYSRQTMLDEIRPGGQQKILDARVLIVGAGGLGSPVAMYLSAAGVGHIGIADDDTVSISNLQRQVLYTEDMLGMPKANEAAKRLSAMNSDIEVIPIKSRIDTGNAEDIIKDYEIIVDCCDNYRTRALLCDKCRRNGKTYIYGAIQGFEGQVSVFDDSTCGYTDLFPTPQENPSPAVLGMTAGIVGCVQAGETVKTICGFGETLRNKLWTIDLRTMQSYIIEL